MSETNELYTSVAYIKNKVDTLEKIELLRLRSDNVLKQRYLDILSNANFRAVYKAVDGEKSQKEIATEIGKSEASISGYIKSLVEEGLLELIGITSKGRIYNHTIVEQAYHLKRQL